MCNDTPAPSQSQPSAPASGPWRTVATYSSFEEAQIVRGMLEANGIPCVVNNATLASVYPMTSTWTPLELMVPAQCAAQAEKLLQQDGDID